MGGVTIRIDPVMVSVGRTALPMPYLMLLRDLVRINAGRPLPRIPQSAIEAQIRLGAERRAANWLGRGSSTTRHPRAATDVKGG